MKTKIMLMCIVLTIALVPAKAQIGGSPTGYIAFNLGNGSPIGNFGSTDETNSSAGYAQLGYNSGFSFAFPIGHSNWGIAAKTGYNENSLDVQSFVDNVAALYPGNYWEAETVGNYSAETILVGGFATIPVHRFAFDFRLMGGIMFATIPTISLSGVNETTYGVGAISIDGANSAAFAFDAGVGVRFLISKKISIMLNYDYLTANPSFSTPESIDANGNETQQNTKISQPFSLFNTTLGIGYQF